VIGRRLLILALALLTAAAVAAGCGDDDDTPENELGVAPEGQVGMSVVGRIDQAGRETTAYGYFTDIKGLPKRNLFSGGEFDRKASAARYTFSATGTIQDRNIINNVIVTDSRGTMDVYLQDSPAAGFKRPGSFARGKRIATYGVRLENIINVTAPNRGTATAGGQLEQQSAESFDAPGAKGKRLGHEGLVTRLALTGSGTRTEPKLPRAFILFAGDLIRTDDDD